METQSPETLEPIHQWSVVPYGSIIMDGSPVICMETSLCTWNDDNDVVPYCSLSEHVESDACKELASSTIKVTGCYNEPTCGGKVKEIVVENDNLLTPQEKCAWSSCASSSGCSMVADHDDQRQCILKNCGCDIGKITPIIVGSKSMLATSSPQLQQAVFHAVQAIQPHPQKKKKMPVWLIIVIVLFAAIVMALVSWLLWNRKKSTTRRR